MTNNSTTWHSLIRIVLKAALLFIGANILFAVLQPLPVLGRLTVYNWLVPGRERLPYGDRPESYNLSLNSLEAMFASHAVSQPKSADEFRVLVMGDSSVWGILLRPDETLTGYLNAAALTAPDGRKLRFYNLGYPMMSLTKDVMLLDYARRFQPDMIVWMVTLESFPLEKQLEPPPVQNNAESMKALIQQYGLNLDLNDSRFVQPNFMADTLIGQRRALADWLRLQLYGFSWATTGIDQVYGDYTPRSNDFEADDSWYGYKPENFESALQFDVLAAGHALAGDVPLLLINEPIFIADGQNSDIRYNFWYPQWAYDAYRDLLAEQAKTNAWRFVDLWNIIAPAEFTDSPVHVTPAGSQQLSQHVAEAVLELIQ